MISACLKSGIPDFDRLDFIGTEKKRPEGWRSTPIAAEKKPSGRYTQFITDKVYS